MKNSKEVFELLRNGKLVQYFNVIEAARTNIRHFQIIRFVLLMLNILLIAAKVDGSLKLVLLSCWIFYSLFSHFIDLADGMFYEFKVAAVVFLRDTANRRKGESESELRVVYKDHN